MKNIVLELDNESKEKLYYQIYSSLKNDILSGTLEQGTKLPSLRKLAEGNGVSVTTVETAYEQLLVEGYIESRPKSGYYVADAASARPYTTSAAEEQAAPEIPGDKRRIASQERPCIYDAESFDFAKWKKCMNRVFNECEHLLQTEADPKGEPSLRQELARYLYQSRGAKCNAEQIVIGAGSQQLTMQLAKILKELGVNNAATEIPGYGPIRNILEAEGFPVTGVPVQENGIDIEKLPQGERTLVYVNPSNQFPSGAVMPVGRRYELINWAETNDGYILEDDYDSELRYRGKPIPAMQGLDNNGRVIYLGSFSSTLYASVKISYMVLPPELAEIFDRNKTKYSQTCSKAEQLCLAFYMSEGYYYRHIKKLRRLYASKLAVAMDVFAQTDGDVLEPVDSKSGMALLLKIKSEKTVGEICRMADSLGMDMRPVSDLCTDSTKVVYFYFYRIPEALLKLLIRQFAAKLNGRR